MTPEQLANIAHRAAEVREDSYQLPTTDTAWDYGTYATTLDEAIQQAVREEGVPDSFWYPISLAFHWWNDLLAWAEHVESGEPIEDMFETIEPEKERV